MEADPKNVVAASELGVALFSASKPAEAEEQFKKALAIDAMLPALPTIGAALGEGDANRAQWIVLAYIAGLGCGQLFWGMFSDRFGRRRILLIGIGSYAVAALLCHC